MEKITQKQLNEMIRRHIFFMRGSRGGIRAVMKSKDFSGLNFQQSNLTDADFTRSCFNGANLSDVVFQSVSFFSCELNKTNMLRGDFSRCDFRGAKIIASNLTNANFSNADMRQGVFMDYSSPNSDGDWGQTGETVFSGSVIRDTNMSGVNAKSTNFSDANLSGIIVHDANMVGANFTGANLSNADMVYSNISSAKLAGAIFDNANLRGVNANGTELEEILKIQKDRKSLAEEGQDLKSLVAEHVIWIDTAGKKGKQLNLTGYDLSMEQGLRNYSLAIIIAKECKFVGLNLTGIKMESSILDDSDFQDCRICEADFRGSSFKSSFFTRANLTGSDFSALKMSRPDGKEVMQKTDFSHSRMTFANLESVNFHSAILQGVDFSNAYLVNCDFKDANLTDAVFDRANLSGANLEGTILENVDISKIV